MSDTGVIAVELAIAEAALAARVAAALATAADVIVLDTTEGVRLAQIVVTDAIAGDGGRRAIVLADRAGMAAALRGGASAVLASTASAEEILLAVRAAAHRLAVLPEHLLESLLAEEDARPAPRAAAPALTARELEVLALLAEGAANKVIARRLGISVHTAKFHVASILDKLDATGRTDAVTHAIRLGLLML